MLSQRRAVARGIALRERLGAGLARGRDLAEEVGVAHVHLRCRARVELLRAWRRVRRNRCVHIVFALVGRVEADGDVRRAERSEILIAEAAAGLPHVGAACRGK